MKFVVIIADLYLSVSSRFSSWTPSFEQIVYFEDNPKIGEKIINECDLIFTLDFNDLNRIGDLGNIINKASSNIVMIDHHQNPKNYADLIFSHPDIGSTCNCPREKRSVVISRTVVRTSKTVLRLYVPIAS